MHACPYSIHEHESQASQALPAGCRTDRSAPCASPVLAEANRHRYLVLCFPVANTTSRKCLVRCGRDIVFNLPRSSVQDWSGSKGPIGTVARGIAAGARRSSSPERAEGFGEPSHTKLGQTAGRAFKCLCALQRLAVAACVTFTTLRQHLQRRLRAPRRCLSHNPAGEPLLSVVAGSEQPPTDCKL